MLLHLYVFVSASAEGAQTGSPYKDQSLSSMEPNPYEGKSGRKPNAETQANYFKLRLLECVAGLDRGFAANAYAAMQVESAALALTEQSEAVMLSWTSGAHPTLFKQQLMTTLNDTKCHTQLFNLSCSVLTRPMVSKWQLMLLPPVPALQWQWQ